MLTELEQRIYNEYLQVSRSARNLPYRLRKDFSNLDSTKTLFVKRIARILLKFPNIHIRDFFSAPYEVYENDEFFDLKFYTTQRALKVYTIFMSREVDTDPDSYPMLQRVSEALKELKIFINQNNLTAEEYILHTTNNFPTFIQHLKERKLVVYILQELPEAISIIKRQDPEVIKFMFGDKFFNNLDLYRTRYLVSNKCKALVKEGLKRIFNTRKTNQII